MTLVPALSCQADSFASSASSAGSASVGSLSDSLRTSSGSSTKNVAEGDYRIVDVAGAERPDALRLKLEHVAHPPPVPHLSQVPVPYLAPVFFLDVPRSALGERGAARGDVVGVRQRPYGYEFAWADTRAAFFLVLAADWQRELEPRPVQF